MNLNDSYNYLFICLNLCTLINKNSFEVSSSCKGIKLKYFFISLIVLFQPIFLKPPQFNKLLRGSFDLRGSKSSLLKTGERSARVKAFIDNLN